MNREVLRSVIESFAEDRMELLFEKNAGYNKETDGLRNFKVAGELQHETPEQALWGMAVKHVVSLSDMIESGETFSDDLWDEKVGDLLNFLLLLRALLVDLKSEASTNSPAPKHIN